jgi:vancomycin resistance protein VanJ
MAILSRFPIVESGRVDPPTAEAFPLLWARIAINDAALTAINAHPRPGRITFWRDRPLPIGFDPTLRDAEIMVARSVVDPLLNLGERVLLLGDFNVTEREPAYRDLSARLTDAHRAAGSGFGHSWRPAPLKHRAIGIIRIDYLFGSAGLTPLHAGADCTPSGSDHCRVEATFELR